MLSCCPPGTGTGPHKQHEWKEMKNGSTSSSLWQSFVYPIWIGRNLSWKEVVNSQDESDEDPSEASRLPTCRRLTCCQLDDPLGWWWCFTHLMTTHVCIHACIYQQDQASVCVYIRTWAVLYWKLFFCNNYCAEPNGTEQMNELKLD